MALFYLKRRINAVYLLISLCLSLPPYAVQSVAEGSESSLSQYSDGGSGGGHGTSTRRLPRQHTYGQETGGSSGHESPGSVESHRRYRPTGQRSSERQESQLGPFSASRRDRDRSSGLHFPSLPSQQRQASGGSGRHQERASRSGRLERGTSFQQRGAGQGERLVEGYRMRRDYPIPGQTIFEGPPSRHEELLRSVQQEPVRDKPRHKERKERVATAAERLYSVAPHHFTGLPHGQSAPHFAKHVKIYSNQWFQDDAEHRGQDDAWTTAESKHKMRRRRDGAQGRWERSSRTDLKAKELAYTYYVLLNAHHPGSAHLPDQALRQFHADLHPAQPPPRPPPMQLRSPRRSDPNRHHARSGHRSDRSAGRRRCRRRRSRSPNPSPSLTLSQIDRRIKDRQLDLFQDFLHGRRIHSDKKWARFSERLWREGEAERDYPLGTFSPPAPSPSPARSKSIEVVGERFPKAKKKSKGGEGPSRAPGSQEGGRQSSLHGPESRELAEEPRPPSPSIFRGVGSALSPEKPGVKRRPAVPGAAGLMDVSGSKKARTDVLPQTPAPQQSAEQVQHDEHDPVLLQQAHEFLATIPRPGPPPGHPGQGAPSEGPHHAPQPAGEQTPPRSPQMESPGRPRPLVSYSSSSPSLASADQGN